MHPILAVILIDDIIYLIIFAIVAAGAAYLLAPKPKTPDNPFQDASKPPTLAERGAYLPWLRGRNKIGPIVLCVFDRKLVKYRQNQTNQYKYVESAWHGLAIGPGYYIREMRFNGKLVSRGAISRASHPSGTFVDIGYQGGFNIYWGEDNQAVNTFLASTTPPATGRPGIASRWPHQCYVVWRNVELGANPIWPTIDYVLECRVEHSPLVTTTAPAHNIGSDILSSAPARAITHISSAGAVGTHYFQVAGDRRKEYGTVGVRARIRDTTLSINHTVTIVSKSLQTTGSGTTLKTFTRVVVAETLVGYITGWTAQPFLEPVDDGPNGAHLLAEAMFAPWPWGFEIDQDEFHIPDFDAFADLLLAEGISTNVCMKEGRTLGDLLKILMEDLSFYFTFDPRLGKTRLLPIREPALVSVLPAAIVIDPMPQPQTVHQEKAVTKPIYTYNDREHRFRTANVPIQDDAQEVLDGYSKPQTILMESVNDRISANKVAERKSLEQETNETGIYQIHANHDARYLYPGLVFSCSLIPTVVRLTGVVRDPKSGHVLLKAVTDYYGGATATFVTPESGGLPDTDEDDPDIDLSLAVEEPAAGWNSPPPGALGDGSGGPPLRDMGDHPTVFFLRWRQTKAVGATRISISDAGDLREIATVAGYQTGGFITTDLAAAAGPLVPVIEIHVQGADIDEALDLTADLDGWRAGKQLAFIGGEVFFVKNVVITEAEGVTPGSMGTAELRDCIRARYTTAPRFLPAGTACYLGVPQSIEIVTDPILAVGSVPGFKGQPTTGNMSPDLTEVATVTRTLIAPQIVPRAIKNINTVDRTLAWSDGEEIEIQWNYFAKDCCSCNAGAGEVPCGRPVPVHKPKGHFNVYISDEDGSPVRRQITGLKQNNIVYNKIERLLDFGGSEPATFRVTVEQVSCGYVSAESYAIFTNVT